MKLQEEVKAKFLFWAIFGYVHQELFFSRYHKNLLL